MWPGMRPATGWMAYFTSPPRFSMQLGQLAHRVLRLRDRHAVAGDDDHRAARRRSWIAASSAAIALHGEPFAVRPGRERRAALPKAPNSTLANERFIALLIRIERRSPTRRRARRR